MRYRRRVTTIAVLSAVALTTSALAATPVDVQWSTPQAISTPPTPGAGPNNGRAAIAEDGTDAVAVWAQDQGDSKFQVWTANTHDSGTTWSSPGALSADGVNAEFPDLALSDDGTRATAIWYVSVPAGQAVRSASSTNGGDTWTARTIAAPVPTSGNPHIAGSADGTRLVATWSEYVTEDVLRVAHSTDGGLTWSTPVNLSDPDSSAGDVAIALAAGGSRAVAAYTQYDGANSRAVIRTSPDGGATWDPPITLSVAGENASQPQIALSADGNRVALAWVQYTGSDPRVQASYSADAGATWSSPEFLSPEGEDAALAQIGGSADGQELTVAWQSAGTSDYRIQSRSSTNAGAAWTPTLTHSADSSAADNPVLAVSADGTTATVAWYRIISFQTSRAEIVTSVDSGTSWTAPDTLSDTAYDASDPMPAVSADGRTIITTWAGADSTDLLVFASTGTVRTVPGAPTGVSATAGDAQLTVSWNPPVDDGGSPITGYTATATPGGPTCTTSGTSCAITELSNGTEYTVTVTAANALGTGPPSRASNAVTPMAPSAQPLPAQPLPTDSPAVVDDPPSTTVIAKANDAKSKLKVKVKPDLGKKKQWEFVVKIKSKGEWKTLKTKKDKTKVYETEGPDHKLTIDLDEGKYKAKSKAARGHEADTSDVVKLKK